MEQILDWTMPGAVWLPCPIDPHDGAWVADGANSHETIVTGGGRASVAKPAFNWVNTVLGNIKNAITGTLHAVSPRHVPRYLAGYEYRFNRRFDLAAMIERFAHVALQTPPMPQRLLTMAGACR